MATPTLFQKIAVDHVPFPLDENRHGGSAALDYEGLRRGGFEAVYFRPEEPVDYVALRMQGLTNNAQTFRGTPFDCNLWVADPGSADSQAAGIPTDPIGWGKFIVEYVKALRWKLGAMGIPGPRIVKLNGEFSVKGYPPWKSETGPFKPWMHVWAQGSDGVKRLYYTPNGGTTGHNKPSFPLKGISQVNDNGVKWVLEDPSGAAYPQADGWDWCERAAASIASFALPDQLWMTQPMGGQGDYNRGVWKKKLNARESPQCYGDQPYNGLRSPKDEIDVVANDPYAPLYHGINMDRRLVHPTIGAYGQGDYYVPKIREARNDGPFGFSVYRHDGFAQRDYEDYLRFAIV